MDDIPRWDALWVNGNLATFADQTGPSRGEGGYGEILGGAVGNLVDRVRLGEVVDFIRVGIPPNNYWPVFNVADSAVTIGVLWLALTLVRDGKEQKAQTLDSAMPGVSGSSGQPTEDRIAPVAPSRGEQ